MENFCTIFDSNFLPIGLTLARTLKQHCPQSRLWIICLDHKVYEQLKILNLSHVQLISLDDIETDALRAVKHKRSRAEYAWTLAPFACDAVFRLAPQTPRATYLDADLGFYDSPLLLINEMVDAGKEVLITEHAFSPKYTYHLIQGRFCVQFITFNNTSEALAVMHRWQEQVLDWCYARLEDGKFGDQKYLDAWPQNHAKTVHILKQTHRTLAPWNVSYMAQTRQKLEPVFYHFHGLRLVSPQKLRLFIGYHINAEARILYDQYIMQLQQSVRQLQAANIPIASIPLPRGFKAMRERIMQKIRGTDAYTLLDTNSPD